MWGAKGEGGEKGQGGSNAHIWDTSQSKNCLAPRKAAQDAAFITAAAAAAGDEEDGVDLGDDRDWNDVYS